MNNNHQSRAMSRLRVAALAAVILIGGLALLGWLLNIEALTRLFPGFASMKANTALGMTLLGAALLSKGRLRSALAGVVFAIAVLTLVEYAFNVNLGIDELLFADPNTLPENFPGRPSAGTTVGLALLSSSVILLGWERWAALSQALAIAAGAVAFVALVEYLYDAEALYTTLFFQSMSLRTSVSILLLSLAVLLTPDAAFYRWLMRPGPAGQMTRRLLPPIQIIPALIGWIILLAMRPNQFDRSIAVAVYTMVITVIMTLLVLWSAGALHQSDQKRLQAEVERDALLHHVEDERNRLQRIFDASLGAMALVDGEMRIVDVNPAVCNLVGYSRDEMLRMALPNVTPADLQEELEALWQRLMEAGAMRGDFVLLHHDGGFRDVEFSIVRDVLPDNHLVAAHDVTERKQAEQALLEQQRLQAALDKERELAQIKNLFMSKISHEFRTPLAIIRASSDTLERYWERLPAEGRLERLNTVALQVDHLAGLMDQVGYMLAGQHERIDFNPEPGDLAVFAERLMENIREALGADQAFVFESTGDLQAVWFDHRLVRHILTNLLTNAIKYSPQDKTITLTATRQTHNIKLQVRDQGMGISAADRERIFEPFFRSRTVEHVQGVGVGLKVAHDCARAHQGSLSVDSEVDKGSTFTVTLPLEFQ